MRQPPGGPRGSDLDDRETIYAGQERDTPPTIPLGDQAGWDQPQQGGFVRTVPEEGITPGPYQPAPPPPYREEGDLDAHTVIISERPTPVFAWLVVVDGPDRSTIGTVHTLHPDTTSIGRVAGNQVVLRDNTCSAQHARIRKESLEGEEAAFVLYDMGSRNGTFVGDREAYKDDESRVYRHILQDGDFLLMGETSLAFKKL
jgi:pSer/pThr/pTyr-binding forkhead associated (FHA) protein